MNNLKTSALGGKKLLIPFITCGDPSLDFTKKASIAMAECGVDAIILGIPFSDPTAEGAVVYEANLRALAGGATTDKIISLAGEIKREINIPIIFMTYANVVFSYGTERFLSSAKAAGASGLVLFDIPFEERNEFLPECEKYAIDLIPFVAKTSTERIENIAKNANGIMFTMGTSDFDEISGIVSTVKSITDTPCVAGFDDLTPDMAKKMVSASCGIAICTDIVKITQKYGKKAVSPICKYIKSIKKAIS